MGNKPSDDVKYLTGSTQEGIEKLNKDYKVRYKNKGMTREEFIRDNMGLKGGAEEFWSSVFDAIDSDRDGYIDFKEYLLLLTISSQEKSSTEKLSFLFDLLDANGDGHLDEREIYLVSNLFLRNISFQCKFLDIFEENKVEIAEPSKLDQQSFSKSLFSLMDVDSDGQVEREEFISTCLKNPGIQQMLVQSFDQVEVLETDQLRQIESINTSSESHQVGGHTTQLFVDDLIYKPLVEEEFEFYEMIKQKSESDECPEAKEILPFLPPYRGRQHFVREVMMKKSASSSSENVIKQPVVEGNNNDQKMVKKVDHYLIMKNLTHGMKKPCCLDVKMGREGYAKKHSKKIRKKIHNKIVKAISTQGRLGFRMAGMKVYKRDTKKEVKLTKAQGTKLTSSRCEDMLATFVNTGKEFRTEMYQKTAIPWLQKLLQFFEKQKKWSFFSSSVLFFYDGDDPKSEMVLGYVDFAHVFELDEKLELLDEDMIFGIKNLIRILENIVKKYPPSVGGD